MYIVANLRVIKQLEESDWGTFINPDKDLENHPNPPEKYNIVPPSGYKADFLPFLKNNALFDSIISRIIDMRHQFHYEDQCSAKYYYDAFTILNLCQNDINRIVEVGVYLGGASCIFAGSLVPMNKTLDLIDINKGCLLVTYERIRRLFPEAASRVRLFHGDLPSYVNNVMSKESDVRYLVQHDGSHQFNEVLRDLASLYYVKSRVNGIMIQDTHLRSARIDLYTFVDAAIYSVFGFGMKYHDLGIKSPVQTEPAYHVTNYFLQNYPEGMYIPFAENNFLYPHPSAKLESFLPTPLPDLQLA